MEGKEMTEEQVFAYINNVGSANEAARQEAINFLQTCTYQVQFLPFFQNSLQQCIISSTPASAYYCILVLRDLMLNRGCLLQVEDHENHIQTLLSIADSVADKIASQIPVLNVFSDAVSVSVRFIFEKRRSIFEPILLFYEGSEYHRIIATSILISTFNIFDKQMNHLSPKLQENNRNRFSNTIEKYNLFNFPIRSIIASISTFPNSNQNIVKGINVLGTDLFAKITHFYFDNDILESKKWINLNSSYFSIAPSDLLPPSFFVIDTLFSLYDSWEPKLALKAVECLRCYLSLLIHHKIAAVECESFFNTILYLIHKTTQTVVAMANTSNESDYCAGGYDKRNLLPLLVMIATSFNLNNFFINIQRYNVAFQFSEQEDPSAIEIIDRFIAAVEGYTSAYLIINPNGFFNLWRILVNNISEAIFPNNENYKKPDIENVIKIIERIFDIYMNFAMDSSDESKLNEISNQFFSMCRNGPEYLPMNIWRMFKNDLPYPTQFIVEQIHKIISEFDEREIDQTFNSSYQKMLILITLVSGFINSYSSLVSVDNYVLIFSDIFNSVIDFIQSESSNLEIRLGNIGGVVAKTEYCIAMLFKTYQLLKQNRASNSTYRKISNAINDHLKNYIYKENEVEHFFIEHFVQVIKIFHQFPDLLEYIIDIIDNLDNRNTFLLVKNKKFNEISKEKYQPFNLDTVPLPFLERVIPNLYKIYCYGISSNEWGYFLSTFDPLFSPQLANPKNCFLLYSQISGIISFCNKTSKLLDQTFNWMLYGHLNHTILSLQTHCKNKLIVSAIMKAWLSMGPKLHNSHEMINKGSGIEYFRANAQILLILKKFCENSQGESIDLIHNCIYNDYANYGIMNHFGDNSLQVILENFFVLIGKWAIGEAPNYLIEITQVLEMFPRINLTKPVLLDVEQNFNCACEFLINNLLLNKNDPEIKNIWNATCTCLFAILEDLRKHQASIRRFMQFFIILLDAAINMHLDNNDSIVKPFFILFKNEPEFSMKICAAVIEAFEEQYRKNVSGIFHEFFEKMSVEESDLRPSNAFYDALLDFSNSMKTYHIEMANIPEFQIYFRRTMQ